MFLKNCLAAAALATLAGAPAYAAVITGLNTDNLDISTTALNTAGTTTIYDRSLPDGSARSSGRIVFDGSESDTPGLKIVNDAALSGSNGDVSNCVMANSTASCNSEKQSGKRLKFQRTAHEATDLVFNVNKDGIFTTTGNDGLYKFFSAYANATSGRLGSFSLSLGTGVGAGFIGSGIGDGLSFKQTFDGKAPNNSQFSALFANGLFGGIDEVHPLTGYFSEDRSGYDMAFTGEDSFQSTGLFGDYQGLFGNLLSFGELPQGFFYDDDGNADTDNVLIAHQLADGTWVRNRGFDAAGNVITEAYGNNGALYDTEADLVAYLKNLTGLDICDGGGTACLAGSGAIDDLAKFNLTFFIDPTAFAGDQFTLRFESTVPEPGSLALAALALGVAGVSRRRRGA
jgi:hypothetical protein